MLINQDIASQICNIEKMVRRLQNSLAAFDYSDSQRTYMELVKYAERLVEEDKKAFPERRIDGSARNPV